MNLIEKLGGYDDSRKSLQWLIDNDEDYIQEESNLYHACLQYRRENNIFEDGDKIVHIYDCENSMLFTVKDITEKGYSFGNDWGWKGVISNMGVGHTFRHATPEEIKAGHRL